MSAQWIFPFAHIIITGTFFLSSNLWQIMIVKFYNSFLPCHNPIL
jgi:hypothetical protein